MQSRVVVGMSGGVDSAVAAYVLKEAGYDVVGVFMKNWDETIDGGECTAAADFRDVQSVCDAIDIPYYTVNFQQEYYDRVFTYFLDEYKSGRTPNPDVMCNSEIKFDAFLEFAYKTGASAIATGHYARLDKSDGIKLLKGKDAGKDQSYFLCMLTQNQLKDVLFPVGDMEKPEVRKIAEELNLSVADKKDSTGICFIGERKFKEFLKKFLPAIPGEIRSLDGEYIGQHDGLMYYTLGQRRGLDIGGRGTGERWFVVEKDLKNNVLFVVQGDQSPLYSKALTTTGFNWISGKVPDEAFDCMAKFRYRQADQKVRVTPQKDGIYIDFAEKQRAVTPGQYAVLYDGEVCLGGGVIDKVIK
ncbi:MAG: tRNA 2-thiouridine(34) synthase MnmA [Eubacteriales bacterium]